VPATNRSPHLTGCAGSGARPRVQHPERPRAPADLFPALLAVRLRVRPRPDGPGRSSRHRHLQHASAN